MNRVFSLLFCILLVSLHSKGQLLTTNRFSNAYIYAAGEYETAGKERRLRQPFSIGKAMLYASVPLAQKLTIDDEMRINAYNVVLKGYGAAGFPDTRFLSGRTFINSFVGVGFNYLHHTRNIFSVNASANIAEDDQTISSMRPRWTGSFIYMHLTTHKFAYAVGGAYSYVLGKGYVFPVVGITAKAGEKGRIVAVLPFTFQYIHLVNDNFRYKIFMQPGGGVNRVFNNDSIAGLDRIFLFKRREGRLGVTFIKKFSSAVTWNISTGFATGRAVALGNTDVTFRKAAYKYDVSPSVFINTGLLFTIPFKSSGKKQKSSAGDDEIDELLKMGVDIDDLAD